MRPAADRPKDDLRAAQAALCKMVVGESLEGDKPKYTTAPAVTANIAAVALPDSELAAASGTLLKGDVSHWSSRRLAYVQLFAGQRDALAATLRNFLAATGASPVAFGAAVNDVAVVLAVSRGSARDAHNFTSWLGSSSRDERSAPPTDAVLAELSHFTESSRPFSSGVVGRSIGAVSSLQLLIELTPEARAQLGFSAWRDWNARRIDWGMRAAIAGDSAWTMAFWSWALKSTPSQAERAK